MKKILTLLLAVLAVSTVCAWKSLNYASPENWIICEKEKSGAAYDLFYLHPTLSSNPNRIFLDRNDAKIMQKVRLFAGAQTGIFAKDARVFAPFVRQLEFHRITKSLQPENNRDFLTGVSDAQNALRYYRRHYRRGRPFILVGHSQGAMELYVLLKEEIKNGHMDGFVAAYLIGLPQVTTEKIRTDFRESGVRPARGAEDTGVIIVWNSQSKDAVNSIFTVKGGYCINPLNWKTDGTPAAAAENKGSFFYDYRDSSVKTARHLCGARVDPEKGALIVDLPSAVPWHGSGFLGKGVFHINDIWFFAENMRENMLLRVRQYQKDAGRR